MKRTGVRSDAICRHAAERAQQRGIPPAVIRLIQDEHDRVLFAGNGCRTISLTRQSLRRLRSEGVPASVLERAANVALVEREDDARMVTVLHATGRASRRYRRQMPTRRNSERRSWQAASA